MEDHRGYFCGMQADRVFHYDGRDPEEIFISDIVRSLTRLDRYNGHGKVFWSVATHTLLCIHLAREIHDDKLTQVEMLCHDFEEAYIGDVIAPMKRALYPRYHEFIEPVRRAVRYAFQLEGEYPAHCRELDTLASWIETRYLFGPNTWEKVWGQPTPLLVTEGSFMFNIPFDVLKFSRLSFSDAAEEFVKVIVEFISDRLNESLQESNRS